MNTQPQTIYVGQQPLGNQPYDHLGSNQVHPQGSRAPTERAKPRCPCSVNFKGNVTCGNVAFFMLCVLFVIGYVGTLVIGAVLYNTCKENFLPIYLIIGSIACICMLFVLVFAVWLCNRCFDTHAMVVITVVGLTALVFGSFSGTLVIAFGECDMLIKYVSIGSTCPVWLVVLLVIVFLIYRNY